MFTVYTDTDLSVLSVQFAQDTKTRVAGADPLEPEYLVIQTPGMKKYLALECARRNTIFTQVRAIMPKQFIMDLAFQLTGMQEHRSMFERDVLPWAIYRLINNGIENNVPELADLDSYGGGENNEARLFSLAQKIADIFDQYMLYRPEVIEAWEAGRWKFDMNGTHDNNEVWQRYIWNMLVEENTVENIISPAQYIRLLFKALDAPDDAIMKKLPKRVFLFGMSILPQQYLDVFVKLGKRIDVTLYLQVPSIFYFGDVLSDKQIRWRQRNPGKTVSGAFENAASANALLRNFGKIGKEFMDMLLAANAQPMELSDIDQMLRDPKEPVPLLRRMQRDVLLCNDAARTPIECDEDPWSIRFASCYGPLREVEVVHDLLLDCFAADASLTPADVLITTPDLELYGPLVNMVFDDAKERCGVRIPFSLADQSILTENTIARFAKDLLAAAAGRFEVSLILSLFENACELSKAPLSLNDRDLLRTWCERSGIRWGYNAAFMKGLGLSEKELFTWRYGIDRLIAGYVMDDESRLEDGLFPSVEVEGEGTVLLGRLAEFVDSLAELAALSTEHHTISTWNEFVAPLIGKLLDVDEEFEDDGSSVASVFAHALAEVREQTEVSGTKAQKFPFAIYMQSILDVLEKGSGGHGFFSGAVTVAGMIPMRSIPFKVVVMMGMNRGKFPRHTVRPLFDLMGKDFPRPGDRDSLTGDRYLFLESILSAREKLIVTWNGFDDNGRELQPSAVVDELKAHLDREYCVGERKTPGGESVLVRYPLHPFSARYTSNQGANVLLNTWNAMWFTPRAQVSERIPMFQWVCSPGDAEENDLIEGNRIIQALVHPMKSFLSSARIERPSPKDSIPDSEPFAMDHLVEWQVRDAIKKETFCGNTDAVARLGADARIPPGTPGDSAIMMERKKVQYRIGTLHSIQPAPEFKPHRIDLLLDTVRYRMNIDLISIQQGIAVIMDMGRINPKRRVKTWVTHLYLNLDQPTGTKLLALDGTIHLGPISKKDAVHHIADLNSIARESRKSLLPFILDVSWECLQPKEKEWDVLESMVVPGDEHNFNYEKWYAEAFDHASDWDEAMAMIPGGNSVFRGTAEKVFRPYIDNAVETK